jgi:hypothetical protein
VLILSFFIFVVLVVVYTLALGYDLSSSEGRNISRRCRISHEMYRRRNVKRRRVRCRFGG